MVIQKPRWSNKVVKSSQGGQTSRSNSSHEGQTVVTVVQQGSKVVKQGGQTRWSRWSNEVVKQWSDEVVKQQSKWSNEVV